MAVARLAPPPRLALPPALTAPGATLLLGDLHGTREIPGLVGDLVEVLAADRPVVVALEVLAAAAPGLPAYLSSDGGPAARQALLADPWWRSDYQDGRRSAAMAHLIERVRRLRVGGARVEVLAIDAMPTDGTDRDEALARNVRAVREAHLGATLVVYAGNLHTARKGVPGLGGRTMMAGHLARGGLAFVSLNPRYDEGTAWVCMGPKPADCGPRVVGGARVAPGVHLEPTPDGNYDGWIGLGPLTASPPAAFPALAEGLDARLAALRDGPEAWRGRARRAAATGDYAACLAHYAHVTSPTGDDAYDQACCHARLGHTDAAFERLGYALAHGFSDLAHARVDPDLEGLHADPRWPPTR